MANRVFLAGILGGIMLFIWGAISWMFLPWHENSMNRFSNEGAVAQAIQSNAPKSGIYMMPMMSKDMTATTTQASGPLMFASVRLEGMPSTMIPQIILGLIISIILALLASYLVFKTLITSYFGRVGFIIVLGLLIALETNLNYWNWFYFSAPYTLTVIIDTVIGWFLAGLVIAGVMAPTRRDV